MQVEHTDHLLHPPGAAAVELQLQDDAVRGNGESVGWDTTRGYADPVLPFIQGGPNPPIQRDSQPRAIVPNKGLADVRDIERCPRTGGLAEVGELVLHGSLPLATIECRVV